MATVNQGLKWTLQADTQSLTSGLKRAAKAWKDYNKDVTAASGSTAMSTKGAATAAAAFMKMGKAAVAFMGVRQLLRFGAAALAAGEQMEKLRNVSDRVFGDMSVVTQAWSSEVAGAYALAEREALTYTNRLGSMLASMGITNTKLGAMTLNLSKFAGELAYINGLSTDQALSAVQSALTGDGEALRRLGYNLSAVSIQEYMYSQGLDMTFRSLNAKSQALVRHNYLMQQSAYMQGFAAEMSNTWSGQVNKLSGTWDQFKSSMGEVLTVVLMPVLRFLNLIVGALAKATQAAMIFMRVLFGLAPKVITSPGSGGTTIGDSIAEGLDNATGSAKKLRKEIGKLAGFDQLNVLPKDTDTSGGSSGIGAPGAGSINLDLDVDTTELERATSVSEAFKAKWTEIAESISANKVAVITAFAAIGGAIAGYLILSNWASIVPVLGGIANALGFLANPFTVIKTVLGFVSSGFATLGSVILNTVMHPVTTLKTGFELLATALATPIGLAIAVVAAFAAIAAAIVYLWQTNEDFKNTLIEAWNAIKELVVAVWDSFLKPTFEALVGALILVWEYGVKPLWDGFVNMVDAIVTAIAELWLEIQPIYLWFVQTFGPALSALVGALAVAWAVAFAAIGTVMGGLFTTVGNVFTGIKDIFIGIIQFVKGVFTGDWRAAWEGVKNVFGGIIGTFSGLFKGVWDTILGLFSNGGKIFSGIKDGIVGVFRTIVNSLIGGINTLVRKPFDAINGMLNSIRSIKILGVKPFQGLWGRNPIGIFQIPTLPPAYEQGTNFVPETGLALLHKGETVVPAKQGKKFQGTSGEELELLREQVALLREIREKDTSVNLDGEKVSSNQRRVANRRNKALGYT